MIRFGACYFWICLFLFSCKNEPTKTALPEAFRGLTMGTYYSVKIPGNKFIRQESIDSILIAFNQELSTYIDSSFISQVNDPVIKSKMADIEKHFWFYDVTKKSKLIFELSNGDFDPTVNPLVEYWGFGLTKKPRLGKQSEIDSIMKFVSFNNINLKEKNGKFILTKSDRRTGLDYSAIAKGYGVDVLSAYVESQGIQNYLIEIGGETKTKGKKINGSDWTLGINKPSPESSLSALILNITPKDQAVASSGNYRNYYEIDGKILAHTINPRTGNAQGSDLLAITVLANECWYADAIATACMVKGLKGAQSWIEKLEDVEACFFYEQSDGITYSLSSNFDTYLLK